MCVSEAGFVKVMQAKDVFLSFNMERLSRTRQLSAQNRKIPELPEKGPSPSDEAINQHNLRAHIPYPHKE